MEPSIAGEETPVTRTKNDPRPFGRRSFFCLYDKSFNLWPLEPERVETQKNSSGNCFLVSSAQAGTEAFGLGRQAERVP